MQAGLRCTGRSMAPSVAARGPPARSMREACAKRAGTPGGYRTLTVFVWWEHGREQTHRILVAAGRRADRRAVRGDRRGARDHAPAVADHERAGRASGDLAPAGRVTQAVFQADPRRV